MDVIELASRTFGASPASPIILLHGLLGDGSNLTTLAKFLEKDYRVHLVDLRNHGRSPHCSQMNLNLMAADVIRYVESHSILDPIIFGHSLGGKVAMQLAVQQPQLVKALIVEDIAPVEYPDKHLHIIEALQSIDLSALNSRAHADELLNSVISDEALRSFLLKNLVKNSNVHLGELPWKWRCNLKSLHENYTNLSAAVESEVVFSAPTLFIKGELSSYITQQNWLKVIELFPQAKLKIIQGAGHWSHSEKPSAFNQAVKKFLNDL